MTEIFTHINTIGFRLKTTSELRILGPQLCMVSLYMIYMSYKGTWLKIFLVLNWYQSSWDFCAFIPIDQTIPGGSFQQS